MATPVLTRPLRALAAALTSGPTAEQRRFRRQARTEMRSLTTARHDGPTPREKAAAQMLQHSHATADFSYLLPQFFRRH